MKTVFRYLVRLCGFACISLVVLAHPVRAEGTGASTSAPPPSVGNSRVLIVLLNVNGTNAFLPFDALWAKSYFNNDPAGVHAFFAEASYGKLNMVADVVDWLDYPFDDNTWINGYCSVPWNYTTAVDSKLNSLGYVLGSYNHIIYVTDRSCGAIGGYTQLPGNRSWQNGAVQFYRPAGLAHEMGHNFGLGHADTLTCAGKTISSVTGACTVKPYGDTSSAMSSVQAAGGQAMGFSSPERAALGWFDSTQINTVTANGTFTLTALAGGAPGIKVLKIPRPNHPGQSYYVSYRTRILIPDPAWHFEMLYGEFGTLMHLFPYDASAAGSLSFDVAQLTPHVNDPYGGARPLNDGLDFEDVENGISVRQLAHTDQSATIEVKFAPIQCALADLQIQAPDDLYLGGGALAVTIRTQANQACVTSQNYNLSYTLPSGATISGTIPPSSVSLLPAVESKFSIGLQYAQMPAVGIYPLVITAVDASNSTKIYKKSVNVHVTSGTFIPPNLSVTSDGQKNTLVWSGGNYLNIPIEGYVIRRQDMGGYSYYLPSSATSWSDPFNLHPGAQYTYQLYMLLPGAFFSPATSATVLFPGLPSSNPPLAEIMLPDGFSWSLANGDLGLFVKATPTQNGIVQAKLYLNGVYRAISSSTYGSQGTEFLGATLSGMSNFAPGTYTLEAQVTDSLGLVGKSTKTIYLTSSTTQTSPPPPAPTGDTIAPSVQITSPLNGSMIQGRNLSVSIAANDNVGVTQIYLYVDGVLKASKSVSGTNVSISVGVSKLSSGTHSLVAKAYDAAGNVGTSSTVNVTK